MRLLSQPRARNASPAFVLVIVCAGVVLASLDLFIVNVALPAIARDLHQRNLADLSWVLNAYAIAYAALLIPLGRLAEGRRRDRGFLLGVAVFTIASAACGASSSLGELVAFRIVQAAGAALLTPTSLGLVLATSAPERRQGSVRAWTAVGGLAAALGPVVGGVLVAASWRWVFLVNVPIGALALIVGWRRLPEVAGHPVRRPDALAAGLVTAGIAALTLGLVKGGDWGWAGERTLGVLAAAIILLVMFVGRLRRRENPLVSPALFRARAFSGSSIVSLVFSIAFGAMLLSRVLWFQDVWGWSALRTGLAIAPGPLMVPLFSFVVAARLIPRIGAGRVVALGALTFAAGSAWWVLAAGARPDYAGEMLGGMLLTGIGVGLTLPTYMAAGAASLPPDAFATGSAVLNMLRQVGLAIGVAMFVAVLGTPHGTGAAVDAFRAGAVAITAVSLLAALAGATLTGGAARRRRSPAPKWRCSGSQAAATDVPQPERS